MDDMAVSITFDENNQIRVLESDKFKETENLKNECMDFLKSKKEHFQTVLISYRNCKFQ